MAMSESPFINPLPSITIAEIIDIFLVATLLYTAVVWAQRTRAALVVRGILVFGGIYIIARYLELQMVAWIFQGFFAIFLIMIVVIFQEELRHLFEQTAVWSLNFKKPRSLRSESSDVIARTLADLAKSKTGALIVIRGKDPLERHITGGIPLDGKVSGPLLRSIFDTHSPGHDGAVLVEDGQITRFAAHLPLSKDLSQTANAGTRHSAALGLAELCDALCLVVSEERGQVSVARNSRLRLANNLQEIAAAIDDFLQREVSHPREQRDLPRFVPEKLDCQGSFALSRSRFLVCLRARGENHTGQLQDSGERAKFAGALGNRRDPTGGSQRHVQRAAARLLSFRLEKNQGHRGRHHG